MQAIEVVTALYKDLNRLGFGKYQKLDTEAMIAVIHKQWWSMRRMVQAGGDTVDPVNPAKAISQYADLDGTLLSMGDKVLFTARTDDNPIKQTQATLHRGKLIKLRGKTCDIDSDKGRTHFGIRYWQVIKS